MGATRLGASLPEVGNKDGFWRASLKNQVMEIAQNK